jgi:putative heme degradation protein
MEPPNFIALCFELRERRLIKSTRNLDVEESVAIFLVLTGHCQEQRIVADRFKHSTETINRHYNKVLKALGHLGKVYIKVRHRTEVHPHVQSNPKYYPWFKVSVVHL